MDKNEIKRELQMHKDNLTDSSFMVGAINQEISPLVENYNDSVKSDNLGNIIEKISNLKEPTQESDANISNAESNIQYEIDAVQREIEQEAAEKKAARDAQIASIKASISEAETNVKKEIAAVEKNVGDAGGQAIDVLRAEADAKIASIKANIIAIK